jgi:hypothetical protein
MNPWTFLIFTLANAFWITLSYRVGGDCSWLATKRQPLRAVASLPIETQVSHLVDLFSVMYRDTMPAQSPPSIFSADDKLKAYDQNGTKIIIEPTEYPPIDLEEPVKVAIDHVLQVLALSPESKSKGPIHVVRGVGGGKTLALTVLRGSLAAMDDVLPILITYNSRWSVDDFQRLATLFPDRCDVGYALTVLARMASTYYDVSRDDAESMLYAYEVTLKGLMQGLSGRDAIAAFTIHLARHANKTQVVLLVDESVACVEALDKTYHQYRPTGSVMSKYLIDAMLEFRYDEYGLRGALVLSGTVPVIALVITICDEMCTGGTIDLSNRDDGTMKYTQHGFALEAKDNTCYAFYGSHVAHIVRPLKRGVRYSFVMFFETTRTPTDIAIDWKLQPRKRKPDEAASPERLICRVCTKAYANAKSLRKHRCKPAEHMLLYRGIGS